MRRIGLTLAVATVALAVSAGSASPAQAKCKLRGASSLESIPYAGKGPNVAFQIFFSRIQDCVDATVISTLYTRPCTGDAQNSKPCRARGAPIKVKTASYTITSGDLTAGRDSRGCLPADPRANATPGTTPLCIWSVDQCTVESRKPWHEWWGTVTVSGNRKGATTRKQLKPATAGNLSC